MIESTGNEKESVPKPETLGDRFRLWRESKGWSRSEMADKTGISKAMQIRYEYNRSAPSASTLSKLSANHGLDANWLVSGATSMEDQPYRSLADDRFVPERKHRTVPVGELSPVALSAEEVARLSATYTEEGEGLLVEQVEALAVELAKSGLAWMEEDDDGVSCWRFHTRSVAKATFLAGKFLRRPKTSHVSNTNETWTSISFPNGSGTKIMSQPNHDPVWITASEVAERASEKAGEPVELCYVYSAAGHLEISGLAEKNGNHWRFHPDSVGFIVGRKRSARKRQRQYNPDGYDHEVAINRIMEDKRVDTPAKLASFLGVSIPSISKSKNNGPVPSAWLVKLNVELGLRIRWILYGTGEKYDIDSDTLRKGTGKRIKHKRKCPICGKWFLCSPSDRKRTCGDPECTSAQKSASHLGVRNQWNDESKAAISERGQTPNLERGQAAAVESARGGPFEANANAIWWEFLTPDNRKVRCRNLTKWLRDHAGELPGSVSNARAGFSAMSRYQRGKTPRVVSQWKGYRLIRTWLDENSTRWTGDD